MRANRSAVRTSSSWDSGDNDCDDAGEVDLFARRSNCHKGMGCSLVLHQGDDEISVSSVVLLDVAAEEQVVMVVVGVRSLMLGGSAFMKLIWEECCQNNTSQLPASPFVVCCCLVDMKQIVLDGVAISI